MQPARQRRKESYIWPIPDPPIPIPEVAKEWSIIGMNFLYAAFGVVLMFVAYRVIDLLSPKIDFAEELRKGNVAVGLFVAALFIAIAMVIGGALN